MTNFGHILKLWLVSFFLLFFGFTYAQIEINSTEISLSKNYSIEFNIGYNNFQLNDVKELYEEIVQVYIDENIPIPTQRIYPGNVLFDVTMFKKIKSNTNLGLSTRYSWTNSYSLYEDCFGEINISSKINFIDVGAMLQYKTAGSSNLHALFGLRGGITFANYSLEQEMIVYDVNNLASTSELTANGSSSSIEGYFGLSYKLFNIEIKSKLGFRNVNITNLDGKSKLDNNVYYSGEIPLDVNLSGLILLFGIGCVF